jgi:hypothetical protein
MFDMKKIFQLLGLIILFSFIYSGCRKDTQPTLKLFTPYAAVVNPPDSFIYFIQLPYNQIREGTIQFQNDGVWHIRKTSGISATTWLSRMDKSSVFGIQLADTVALQGNISYKFSASNAPTPDGINIYVQFKKLNKDYQSFSPKY